MVALTKKHVIRDDAGLKAALASMSPDESKAWDTAVDGGADPYHAANLVRSGRAQDAARASVGAEDTLREAAAPTTRDEAFGKIGDGLRAGAVQAGDTATGGGLSTLSALATSLPDLRPDWLRKNTISFGDGSGSGTPVDEEKKANAAVLEDMQANHPGSRAMGTLAGLVGPLLAGPASAGAKGLAGLGAYTGGAPMASSIAKSALTGAAGAGGFGALAGLLQPQNDGLGDYAENAAKMGGGAALLGGAIGGASGVNDAAKAAGGLRGLLNSVADDVAAPAPSTQPAPTAAAPTAAPGARAAALKDAANAALRFMSPRAGHGLDLVGAMKNVIRPPSGGAWTGGAEPPVSVPGAAPSPSGATETFAPFPQSVKLGADVGFQPTSPGIAGLDMNDLVDSTPFSGAPQNTSAPPTGVTGELNALKARMAAPTSSPVPSNASVPMRTPAPSSTSLFDAMPEETAIEPRPMPAPGTAPVADVGDAAGNVMFTPAHQAQTGTLPGVSAFDPTSMRPAATSPAVRGLSPASPDALTSPGVAPVMSPNPTPVPGDVTMPNAFRFGGRYGVPVGPGERAAFGHGNLRLRAAQTDELPREALDALANMPGTNPMRPAVTGAPAEQIQALEPPAEPSPSGGSLQPSLFGGEEPTTSTIRMPTSSAVSEEAGEPTNPASPWDRHAGDSEFDEQFGARMGDVMNSPAQFNPANQVKWQGAHNATRASAMPGMKGALHGRLATHGPPRSGPGFGTPYDAFDPTTQTADFTALLRELGIIK
jgi:hypothetical protein